MNRTQLRRHIGLHRSHGLRRPMAMVLGVGLKSSCLKTTTTMATLHRHKSLAKVSKKQASELVLRQKIKAEHLKESGGLCKRCLRPPDFRGLQLIHKVALSQGGQTTYENTSVWCAPCHFGEDGHMAEMPPGWASGKVRR